MESIAGIQIENKQLSGISRNQDEMKNHPTSKPLDLLSYPLSNSSQENAIVIDTFLVVLVQLLWLVNYQIVFAT